MFGHDNQDDNTDEQLGQNDFSLPDDQSSSHEAVITPGSATVAAELPTVSLPTTKSVPSNIPEPAATDDLLDIKQEALQALTPLVGQLDQTPEEQFRTTMMMIQASDDHSLVRVAYTAAKNISNEKERAQALLDIVNEINYFTQQSQA